MDLDSLKKTIRTCRSEQCRHRSCSTFEKMKKQFALSKTNKTYYGIIAVISIVLFLAFSSKTPEKTGELIGRLVAFMSFPFLVAWIVWRLFGRQEDGGSVTFNVCLTLLLLGQVGQFGNRLQQSQKLEFIQEQKIELKERISNADDPAEIDSAYNEYAESVKEALSELSESGAGKEQQFFVIMNDFVSDMQSTTNKWRESYISILSPRFFDISRLNSDEEFDFQIRIAKHYVTESRNCANTYENMLSNLKERLSVLGDRNEIAVNAIRGASKKYNLERPIYEPLMAAHLGYGNDFIQILELLQQNRESWTFENNEISIYDDSVLKRYNELIGKLTKRGEVIIRLSSQLLEIL